MPAKKKVRDQEIFSAQHLLKQLSDELDFYFNNPENFNRKRLEKMAIEFIEELKLISSNIPSLKNLSESASPGKIWDLIGKVRRVLQSDEVDEYGCDRRFEMAIKPFFDFLFQKYFRVSVHGIENIPSDGKALLVANHSGVLPYDAAMMKIAIYNKHPEQRELRFLVDDFVFHFPFLGVMMNRIGGVRACPENAERLLRQGELVSVFPEGLKGISKPFAERYRLQRFGRGGAIRLALNTHAPIVPVAIVGAEEIHPLLYKSSVLARPLGALPLPTKWTMVFGKPIPFDSYSEKDRHDGILINRENEKLREQIQDMVFDILKDRKSVFFG